MISESLVRLRQGCGGTAEDNGRLVSAWRVGRADPPYEAEILLRLIIGITGATGTIFGVRLLERLRESGAETHLVISRWGARTLLHETPYTREQVEALATIAYAPGDMGASISSGSFRTDGMIIAPCSAKSLAAIAHGYGENLIHRAADVVLKERRKLVLAVREAPLSSIHLENMLTLARMGAMVMPPLPAFYNHPRTIDDIVDYTVARLLDQFGVEVAGAERWVGEMGVGTD
jgi:4-hydroxy-3-polyprenylbenzoate decarboxylase